MSRKIQFLKYQGTGNDFIIIDQWDEEFDLSRDEIAHLCDRRMGIGADGLMYLRKSKEVDFQMIYYNSDGNESTMCGNGGRCISSLYFSKTGKRKVTFLAIDGIHESKLLDSGNISLHMSDVDEIKKMVEGYFIDTGSPHLVIFTADVKGKNINKDGAEIRYSDQFASEGVNVNFMEVKNDFINVRTYERGVEGETLSCGTGVTASAIIAGEHSDKLSGKNGIKTITLGGELKVHYIKEDQLFTNIWLTGPAQLVFKGEATLI